MPKHRLELTSWAPHRFSALANKVSLTLAKMYQKHFDLSVTGWRIIAILGLEAPLSSKELAERIAMDPVGVTRAVTELSRAHLVSRGTDVADRRKAALRLTKRGEAIYDEVVPYAKAIERELLATLNEAERRELHRILSKIEDQSRLVIQDFELVPAARRRSMR